MPEPTQLHFSMSRLPPGDLSTLPLGTYKVLEDRITFRYKDGKGNIFINNYHRGAAGAERKSTNLNQQAPEGQYEEQRSFEARRREQDRISSFIGQENAFIALEKKAIAQLSPMDPQIDSRRAALKDRSEKKNRMAQKLGVDRARLKAEMAESVDAPVRHSRKAEYRKRNKKEQSPEEMAQSEPNSLGILRSMPEFKQFIPPKIPRHADSPGYLPPSLPYFSRMAPPTYPLLESSQLPYMNSESPAESLVSTAYGSSRSSPIGGHTSRHLWNYSNNAVPANMNVSTAAGYLFAAAGAGAGADKGSSWLKMPKVADTKLSSPPKEPVVKQEEADVSHVLASATFTADPYPGAEILVVKQEKVAPADVCDLFQALNDRIEKVENERNRRVDIPGSTYVKKELEESDTRINPGDSSLSLMLDSDSTGLALVKQEDRVRLEDGEIIE